MADFFSHMEALSLKVEHLQEQVKILQQQVGCFSLSFISNDGFFFLAEMNILLF